MGSFMFDGNGLWFTRSLVGERVLYLFQEWYLSASLNIERITGRSAARRNDI